MLKTTSHRSSVTLSLLLQRFLLFLGFHKSQKKILPRQKCIITQERGRKTKLSDYLAPSSGKCRHLGQGMHLRPVLQLIMSSPSSVTFLIFPCLRW